MLGTTGDTDLDVDARDAQGRANVVPASSPDYVWGANLPGGSGMASGLPAPGGAVAPIARADPQSMAGPIVQPAGGAAPRGAVGNAPDYPSDLDQQIIAKEGSGDNAVSPKGAIGRNQIMPGTAAMYGVSQAQLYDPVVNQRLGDQIRRDLWQKYRDPTAVMVAYNAGPGVADRWLAAGKDPNALPAETQAYIGQETPQTKLLRGYATEDRATATAAAERMNARSQEYTEKANAALPGSDERAAAMHEARQALQEARESFNQIAKVPPVYKPTDPIENFGSLATVLGLLGGLMAHRPLSASLGAAADAITALNQKNYDQFKIATDQWKTLVDIGQTNVKMAADEIKLVLEDQRLAYDERAMKLRDIQTRYEMDKFTVEQADKRVEKMLDRNKDIELAKLRIKEMAELRGMQPGAAEERKLEQAAAEKEKEWLAANPDVKEVPADVRFQIHEGLKKQEAEAKRVGSARDQLLKKFQDENPDADARATSEFIASTYPARSANALAVRKFQQENPKATAQDVVRFNADQVRAVAVERAFGAGYEARQVTSMNTVVNHLDTLKQYIDALRNGDLLLANQLGNRISLETGKSAPTNFNMAKEIAGDEIARSIVGSGALADRESMKASLMSRESPDQLFGAIEVAQNFLAGRLSELRRQYARGDSERERQFDDEMLSPTARMHIGEGRVPTPAAAAPPPPSAPPSALPSGIPPGSNQIGTRNGNPVYQAPDGSKYEVHP